MNINAVASGNYSAFARSTAKNMSNAVAKSSAVITDEAVSVRISNEALEKLKSGDSVYKDLDASVIQKALPGRDEVTARKNEPLQHTQRPEIEVTVTFKEGTLASFVDARLSGKMENSNQIANQMETMIRGTVYNKGATVEQRAIDRENALKTAQDIADNYFENPGDAKTFMDTVKKFYNNDVLREKGYVVFDNSDIAPFKSYTMPGAPAGYVRMDYETLRDIMGGTGTQAEKEEMLYNVSRSIVKRFNDNEKMVSETIERVKALLYSQK